MKPVQFLFVGEKRSTKAIQMGATWIDGRLAAKQLFDALRECGIEPSEQQFCNWFEHGGRDIVLSCRGGKRVLIVAMGRTVQAALKRHHIDHIAIVHPAARGAIRKKERYAQHVKEALGR